MALGYDPWGFAGPAAGPGVETPTTTNFSGVSMSIITAKTWSLPAALAAAWLATGCISMGGTKSESTAAAPAPAAAAAPAAPKGPGPGMNAAGEVIDVKKVESGYGQKV
jgi:hypothetical protein